MNMMGWTNLITSELRTVPCFSRGWSATSTTGSGGPSPGEKVGEDGGMIHPHHPGVYLITPTICRPPGGAACCTPPGGPPCKLEQALQCY